MPTEKLPVLGIVDATTDPSSLNERSEELYNFYVNRGGGLTKRPGISTSLSLKSYLDSAGAPTTGDQGIKGIHWDDVFGGGVVFCRDYLVAFSEVSPVAPGFSVLGFNVGGLAPSYEPVNLRISFASFKDSASGHHIFLVAGGGACVVLQLYKDAFGAIATGAALTLLHSKDASWPSQVDSVRYIDGYVIVSEHNTNTWHYASEAQSANWYDYGGMNTAAANSDLCDGLEVKNREIFIFGRKSVEIWENDGTTPFSRIPGGTIDTGCLNYGSVVSADSGLYWISDKREFVRWGGGQLQTLDCPFVKDFYTGQWSPWFVTAYAFNFDGIEFIVWKWPSLAESVILYHIDGRPFWTRFTNWDSSTGFHIEWRANCIAYAQSLGKILVGHKGNAYICEFSRTNYDDIGDDNSSKSIIKAIVSSGWTDHKISKNKLSQVLRFRARSGASDTNDSEAGVATVQWRNDGNLTWSNGREITLGGDGEWEFTRKIHRNGIYRARQWRFSCSDAVPLTITDLEEDYEVLE